MDDDNIVGNVIIAGKILCNIYTSQINKSGDDASSDMSSHNKDTIREDISIKEEPNEPELPKVRKTPSRYRRPLKQDNIEEEEIFQCRYCTETFKFSRNLRKHIRIMHSNKKRKKVDVNTFKCGVCNNMYRNKDTLKQHRKNIHKILDKLQERKRSELKCIDGDCDEMFYNRASMMKHLINDHGTSINRVQKRFSNFEDFMAWKMKEEETTFTFFAKGTTERRRKDGREVHYFSCHKHGSSKAHVKNGEIARSTGRKNVKGRVKSDIVCMASIKAEVRNNKVFVSYVNTHNHPISERDIAHQPIPPMIWKKITTMVLLGKQPEEVLHELQNIEKKSENSSSEHLSKTKMIKRKTIVDCKRRIGFRTKLHEDDFTSTQMLVEKFWNYEHDPVILYKPFGRDVVVGDECMADMPKFDSLFILGLQTKQQMDILESSSDKPTLFDGMHETDAYGCQLYTVMVKDEFGKGYSVGTLIASYIDERLLHYFFTAIKNKNPQLKISLPNSYETMGGYNACKMVFEDARVVAADADINRVCESYNNFVHKKYINGMLNDRIDELIYICMRIEGDDYHRHYKDLMKVLGIKKTVRRKRTTNNQNNTASSTNQTLIIRTNSPVPNRQQQEKKENILKLKQQLNKISRYIDSNDIYDSHINHLNENISNIVQQCKITNTIDGHTSIEDHDIQEEEEYMENFLKIEIN